MNSGVVLFNMTKYEQILQDFSFLRESIFYV